MVIYRSDIRLVNTVMKKPARANAGIPGIANNKSNNKWLHT
jgi:hypothetical protein